MVSINNRRRLLPHSQGNQAAGVLWRSGKAFRNFPDGEREEQAVPSLRSVKHIPTQLTAHRTVARNQATRLRKHFLISYHPAGAAWRIKKILEKTHRGTIKPAAIEYIKKKTHKIPILRHSMIIFLQKAVGSRQSEKSRVRWGCLPWPASRQPVTLLELPAFSPPSSLLSPSKSPAPAQRRPPAAK